MLCGSSEMLFHSLEFFDLSSSWGSRLTSQELAFGMQALPNLALMLTAVACRIKAQNLSRGEGSNFAGLRSAWSSPLSVWAHSTGSVVSSQAPFRVVPPDGSTPLRQSAHPEGTPDASQLGSVSFPIQRTRVYVSNPRRFVLFIFPEFKQIKTIK